MLGTHSGADDGIHIVLYKKGEIYNLGDSLSDSFIKTGLAEMYIEPVKEVKMEPEEKKVIQRAPEVKKIRKIRKINPL